MSPRLIVVSNRVSVPKSKRPVPGGLAVGILAALQGSGGLWYGWNGRVESAVSVERSRLGPIEFVTRSLTPEAYEGYYLGYANRVLWPLFHLRLNLVEYQRRFFEAYLAMNVQMAEDVARLAAADDLIWVHDYHCIPLGRKLRKLGLANPLGFFLHIPFPPYDVFRAVPDHKTLLKYFFAYDLIGFQTRLDRDSFLDTVLRILPDVELGSDGLIYKDHEVKVGVFPIGIDYENIRRDVETAKRSTLIRRLQQNLAGRKLITGVDRLDYSKGLAQRFQAFDHFLERHLDHRENVVFMQVAQPSRSDVPEYQAIRDELDYLAGKINGRYAQFDRIPLRYLNRSFSRPTILGFLALSDIGLITPLRDGMNLVAKEFVAAQDPDDPGVLILSRLAGAAEQLKDALLVTPYNIDGVAEALDYALRMSRDERIERHRALDEQVRAYTVEDWARDFVAHLA
ncbi:MAG: alpha,alpha-trehalose-phosphate synthase (UDP-forming) [Gammaproteobacteria bacterium]|nr:MAG: alpha,alpha-trehalose-phosphate synthase (UDP-forming) [Gammaproteobacteria bacterium]